MAHNYYIQQGTFYFMFTNFLIQSGHKLTYRRDLIDFSRVSYINHQDYSKTTFVDLQWIIMPISTGRQNRNIFDAAIIIGDRSLIKFFLDNKLVSDKDLMPENISFINQNISTTLALGSKRISNNLSYEVNRNNLIFILEHEIRTMLQMPADIVPNYYIFKLKFEVIPSMRLIVEEMIQSIERNNIENPEQAALEEDSNLNREKILRFFDNAGIQL